MRPQTGKKKTKKSGKGTKAVSLSPMEYVKVDEFEATPKYIRGRVSRDQVNAVVDLIFINLSYYRRETKAQSPYA